MGVIEHGAQPPLERPTAGIIIKRVLWLIGFVIAFIGVSIGVELLSHRLGLQGIYAALPLQLAMLLLVLLFAAVDGGTIRSLGLPGNWKPRDVLIIPGLVAVHFFGSILFAFVAMLIFPGQMEQMNSSAAATMLQGLAQFSYLEALWISFLAGFAPGIAEELLFRGFLITRLERLHIPGWLCVALSAAIFGLIHAPGYSLIASLPKALFLGLFAGWFFYKRRSLPQTMIAHFLVNFLAFMLAYMAAKAAPFLEQMQQMQP